MRNEYRAAGGVSWLPRLTRRPTPPDNSVPGTRTEDWDIYHSRLAAHKSANTFWFVAVPVALIALGLAFGFRDSIIEAFANN